MNLRPFYLPLLFIVMTLSVLLAGWLSFRNPINIDLREQPQWQITPAQAEVLNTLHDVTVEAYVGRNPRLRRSIDELINPLKKWMPTLQVTFFNPDTEPVRVRERGINREGQLYIHNDSGRGQLVTIPAPEHVLNAVLALQTEAQQIIHLQGSEERGFLSDDAGSWRDTYQHLKQAGMNIAAVNLASIASIPDNTNILVIADPAPTTLDGQELIQDYLKQGGNLLYSTDQPHPYLPDWLRQISGLQVLSGFVRDSDGQQYGIKDPQMLLITTLGQAKAVSSLDNSPLLAQAAAIMPETEAAEGWTRQPLLYTSEQATVQVDDRVIHGPFVMGWLLTRPHGQTTQSIIILGDSDLFSQHYRQIAGNATLIDNLINALLPERTTLAAASPTPLSDQYITLSNTYLYTMAVLLLFGLPAVWCIYYQYYQRRQRCRYR